MNKYLYYNNLNIKFEIIHQLLHRETVFINLDENNKSKPPIRWLNASCIKFLDKHAKKFKFYEKKSNLYSSLATYKDFPTFSYIWNVKAQQQKVWLKQFQYHIINYDFFIETDSDEDFKEAHDDTKEIKKIFDDLKLKYYLKFSGSKGFHIIIPYEEFEHLGLKIYDETLHVKNLNFRTFLERFPLKESNLKNKTDLVFLFKAINHKIKTLNFLDTIDTSISDIKRICKVAYSLDEKSGLVAYPLNDLEFINFKKEYYTPELVLKKNNYKRGLLWRNVDVPLEQRQRNINILLKNIGIIK